MLWRQFVKQNIRSRKIKKFLLWLDRRIVLKKSMQAFVANPQAALNDDVLLNELVYGWGNENWSALNEYLQACIARLLENKNNVLECGSGLTTLLAGVIAKQKGFAIYSFEHHPAWAAKVQRTLARFDIDSVNIVVTPLKDYGDYAWYSLPSAEQLMQIKPVSLVICDGPPHSTKGGRYGVVPVMKDYFSDSVIILLDDAKRPAEQQVAESWCSGFGFSAKLQGTQKPFMEIQKI